MKIAVSNIAWDVAEDSAMSKLFQREGVTAIDIAPGKYFPDARQASNSDIQAVKEWWLTRGIEITGMQSLLFGTNGLNVFGSAEVQNSLVSHLEGVFRVAGKLNAKKLVFGSPKNRDRSHLNDAKAKDVALNFFKRLGDIASLNGVLLCLEPNPPVYGCNFMTNCAETADIVSSLSHPSVKMQFDTGALAINSENPFEVLKNWNSLIGHIHISEPGLVVVGEASTDHISCAAALKSFAPDALISIEMVATKDEPHEASVGRAIAHTKKLYLS